MRTEVGVGNIDDLCPKVTFGIDTGIGVPKVKEFIENILRQGMENFEILIYRNSAYESSRHCEDSLYADVDPRIRFIDDSPQESWIDVAIREAREEYLMFIDETTEALPALDIEELALIAPVSPDLILFNESADIVSLPLTAVDGGIYEVADSFQLVKTLQTDKAYPVLMRKTFVQAWLSNDILPTPSAYSLGFCAAAQAKTIACLPVQSWTSYDNYSLPDASLVADELAWINCQLDSYSSSGKATLLLSELKRYATRLATILGSTIDAKAESRFLALTGSYTSLLRVTTTSHDSFIKACHTVTKMIEATFDNTFKSWFRDNLHRSDKVFVLPDMPVAKLEESFRGVCNVPARKRRYNYEVVPTDFLPGEVARVTMCLESGSSATFGFRMYDFSSKRIYVEELISSGDFSAVIVVGGRVSSPQLLIYPNGVHQSSDCHATVSIAVEKFLFE